jgi:squalene-hopene/tetraprenyl-beta-curcumene cyclase
MQPASGGFLEATPLTSFVVMSLAACGLETHPVTQAGLRFLVDSVRPDGSWPIDTNLATWLTTLSVNALQAGGEDIKNLVSSDWIHNCQYAEVHPYTGAAPGGWSWTDLSGGVPDVDDTAGALLAVFALERQEVDNVDGTDAGLAAADPGMSAQICQAASRGVDWLLAVQNRDGGWPTFCRGWGKLPFDRSGTDLTAHALRALHVWRESLARQASDLPSAERQRRIAEAVERGFDYLKRQQRTDGSWVPLWFGNENQADEANPIYGTARVLLAYRDLDRADCPEARRGFDWLLSAQDLGGGWGGSGRQFEKGLAHHASSVEETSLALEALLADPRLETDESLQHMVKKGLAWLADAIERNQHNEPSPIGFYFAKLWYYEKLYPLIFATSALAEAIRYYTEPSSDGSRRHAQNGNLMPAPNP